MIGPAPQFFASDVKSFAFLGSDDRIEFLPFPGAFVLKTVLGVDSPVSKFNPGDFRQWWECILAASSRAALDQGQVTLNSSTLLSYGIDFEVIREQHENGKKAHALHFTRLRQTGMAPRREEFAFNLLAPQGIIPKGNSELLTVADALDAAFEYELSLFRMPPGYDFAKNGSDWVDQQLLYYLADPNMHIVTNDARLRSRCSQSAQSSRIVVI